MSQPGSIVNWETILRDEISPRAAEMDIDPEELRWGLRKLCEHELMALRRPSSYGGPQLNELEFRDFQESVARYSGALAFLQTQHQSAVSMIAKSENETLKQEYLPKMGSGERLLGIGFSQLRRPGEPLCRAEPVTGGYEISGQVPWVTGWSFYPEFVLGATLPSGEALFCVTPFTAQQNGERRVSFSAPMKLAAMESALTVSAEFERWFLPESHVVFVRPKDWLVENDMLNITLQSFFALGCARGSLDVLTEAYARRKAGFILDAHKSLEAELDCCRQDIVNSLENSDLTTEEKLRLRAWAIDLGVRCAHAAVTASSGAANSIRHPAQRLYREALVYTVSAQTTPIMEATLERLVRPSQQ